jgi:hypothetical protein
MLQAAHARCPGHPALPAAACRIEAHQAGQPAPHQRSVVSRLRLHLAGLGRQPVLPRAEGRLHPTAPAPSPEHAWRRHGRLPAAPGDACCPGGVDQPAGDTSIGGTRGREPGVAAPRRLRALPPRPVAPGPEVGPGPPTPSGPRADGPPWARHQPRAVPGRLDVSPHGRVAPPPSRPAQRRWPPSAPPRPDRPGPLPPDLPPRPRIAAGSAGPHGVWAAADAVHRDDPRPVAHHHHQQPPSAPQPHPRCLTTLPGAHPPQRRARRLAHAVVRHPRPRPSPLGRRALGRPLRPPPKPEGWAPLGPRPAPRLLGPRPQEAAGARLRPDPHGRPLVGTPAPTHGGAQHPKEVSPPRDLGRQPPLDRGRPGLRQSPGEPRRCQGVQAARRAPVRVFQPRAVLPEASRLGVILPSWRSGQAGPGRLRSLAWCVWRRPWPHVSVTARPVLQGVADSPCRWGLSDAPEKSVCTSSLTNPSKRFSNCEAIRRQIIRRHSTNCICVFVDCLFSSERSNACPTR